MAENLEAIYANRFSAIEKRRLRVGSILIEHFFQRWVPQDATVLDLGAGYCEFINNVRAGRKYALDLNPAVAVRAATGVNALLHDGASPRSLASGSVDIVFSSNFLEHLDSKERVQFCFREARRVLRRGGLLLLVGPNIRFCSDTYWDFFDHYLPLSDRSLVEALEVAGFKVRKVLHRFLPYTMKSVVPSHSWLVRLYLAFPLVCYLASKQFFIAAESL